jgi:hypothetical protein
MRQDSSAHTFVQRLRGAVRRRGRVEPYWPLVVGVHVVPEFVPTRWWHHLLHNQTAWMLRVALLYARRDWRGRFRIITDVPFYLSQ